MTRLLKNTPWGHPDHHRQEADGIVFYSTPSHGGYHLSAQRQACVARRFPAFTPYDGAPWYEEDADWAIVALTFPCVFDDLGVRSAILTARSGAKPWRDEAPNAGWVSVVDWLDNSHDGSYIKARVAKWEAENAHLWMRGGGCTLSPAQRVKFPTGSWDQQFTRIGDGARKSVVLVRHEHYAACWTDEEIEQHSAPPAEPAGAGLDMYSHGDGGEWFPPAGS